MVFNQEVIGNLNFTILTSDEKLSFVFVFSVEA